MPPAGGARRARARARAARARRPLPEPRGGRLRARVPTAENIARHIWDSLVNGVAPARLRCVRLVETSNNSVEYSGSEPTPMSRIEALIEELLRELGEDPRRQGLLRTPGRVARSLEFLTQGYELDPQQILNDAVFEESYNEMVIVKDIDFYSLCEHHMLPFFGRAHVAYVPERPDRRPVEDRAPGRDVLAPPPGAGAADQRDRARDRESPAAARGCGHHRGPAPVHDDARGAEAELLRDLERDARGVRVRPQDAGRVRAADPQPASV